MSRQKKHQVNEKLIAKLTLLNDSMVKAEHDAVGDNNETKYPTVFVVGAPRSGTTLLTQWLAYTGLFGYPTNFISRFYKAPYLGKVIQDILTKEEYDYKGELSDLKAPKDKYKSVLGKTVGHAEPNSFWYMWRRFLPVQEIEYISPDDEEKVDAEGLLNAVACLEKGYDKPVLLKGKMLQFNIDILGKIFPRSLILFVNRSEAHNVESIARARIKYKGGIEKWFEAKPPEYKNIAKMSPINQIVEQVRCTNRSIENGLRKADNISSIRISYENFCDNPESVFRMIRQEMKELDYILDKKYNGPVEFNNTNRMRNKSDLMKKIENRI